MRYLPKSPSDRTEMLAEIGVSTIDDLFASIPEEFQLTRDLAIPRQHSRERDYRPFPWVCREQCGRLLRAFWVRGFTGTTSR